jgi:outer membrane protein TolC
MAVSAAQNPDPVLRLGVDNLPINGSDQFTIGGDSMTMRRIGIMQEFTRSEKRQLRGERYEREAEKALAQKAATVAEIQRDTALAWLDRYYAQVLASLMSDQIKQVRLEIEVAESVYRAGRGSQADVLTARAALVGMEDRASEFKLRVSTAKVALARWVGDAAEEPLSGKPATDQIRLDVAALDADLVHHPTIAVMVKQEELATTEAKLAQANKQSDWSVEIAYSQRGQQFSDMVSIGVSIPLEWNQKNLQNREVAAKLAMAEQARAERDELLRAHVAEVRTMLAEWNNAHERSTRIEHELVPLAVERTGATLAAYRGGKSSLNEVLAAQRNEIEVRQQAVQLELEAARLWAQLNFLFPKDEPSMHAATPHTAEPTLNKDSQ